MHVSRGGGGGGGGISRTHPRRDQRCPGARKLGPGRPGEERGQSSVRGLLLAESVSLGSIGQALESLPPLYPCIEFFKRNVLSLPFSPSPGQK